MAGLVNQIFPGSEIGFKTDFSKVKFHAFFSPKRSSKTSPGNGLKIRPKNILEFFSALRKPRGPCAEWNPLKAGLFCDFSSGQ
jgi:hypothetical protein